MKKEKIDIYTQGGCGRFAAWLFRRTGLPILRLYTRDRDRKGELVWEWHHSFCVNNDGKYIDVEGIHEPESFIKIWTKIKDDCVEAYGSTHSEYKIEKNDRTDLGYTFSQIKDYNELIENTIKDVDEFCSLYNLKILESSNAEIDCMRKEAADWATRLALLSDSED